MDFSLSNSPMSVFTLWDKGGTVNSFFLFFQVFCRVFY